MSWSPGFGIQSTGNTTTVPLTGGATYTGTAEQNSAPDVMCSCYSDTAGTLYFDFSVNGTDWRTFPTAGFTVTAGIHEFHTAVKGPRYFRARFINGASSQSTFQLYTYYGTFRQPSAPIGFTIATDADAVVTKSVLSGIGDTTAKVTDQQALQVTPPPEGKTAFGEAAVAEATPVIQIDFTYNINLDQTDTRENLSGTVTQADRMAVVSTGTNAAGNARLTSRRPLKYNAGQGAQARFTARFTAGVANSKQMAGIANESDGFGFGYNGTSFGVFHRKDGQPEVRTLTITTASTTAENITITLDGDADATVAVTNSGVITTTVNEIAAHDYSDVGTGWDAFAVGDKVIFKSWDAATHSGSFAISATTAAGSYAQNVVGTAPTETWIAQADWNGDDIFDGNGITGETIDPTKGNVYQVKYQWLGFGVIAFYVEDPDDGEYHLVHSIKYSNANTTPSLGDPSMPLLLYAENSGNTSDLIVRSSSMAAFIEGKTTTLGARRGVRNTKTTVTTSLLPIISVRQGIHKNSLAVQTFSKVFRTAIAVEHTKPITIVIIQNGTLTGASWSDIDSNAMSMQVDTSATAITGGNEYFSSPLGKAGQELASFVEDYFSYTMPPGEVLSFCAIASSGTNGEANVSLELLERV